MNRFQIGLSAGSNINLERSFSGYYILICNLVSCLFPNVNFYIHSYIRYGIYSYINYDILKGIEQNIKYLLMIHPSSQL